MIIESPITQITYISTSTNIKLMCLITVRYIKTHNVKKTYYNCTNDVVINKHNTINTNDTYNISKTNNIFNTTDNQYFTKKINSTSDITNNTTRHNHNNHEHNVVKKVHEHIKHINNYDTEINYYSKKPLDKMNYYSFYHDN